MGPKKKDGQKKASAEPDPGEMPETLLTQYQKFCKMTAMPLCEQVIQTLTDEEKKEAFLASKQLVVHPADPRDPTEPRIGPGGMRAICTSILGTAPGMIPYKGVNCLRIWWSKIGDDGACALAELLRLGGSEVQINYLELWDNQIGPRGALALGRSLMVGNNRSLLTLKLDYNRSLGTEGVAALCRGLRTNSTLKQLHLPFCNIDADGGAPIGDMLAFSKLGLTLLNLRGNYLGDAGLGNLCPGLSRTASLTELSLADNSIGSNPDDLEPLRMFSETLMTSTTLCRIDLNHNRLHAEAAEVLLPALAPENARIQMFTVDPDLPTEIFEKLNRAGGGKKGKKGKKGGKKKKK
uniref:Uncharacterized protein n=1 Tax=Rhizochromulina marina TaxID=1034831 RepID=A0A7S2SFQ2_9STRA|mmetsp:Transcript_28663/g.83809  ORF Transcript_28663/g.83809 Transcript_28663/m.83809 type:complete len:351 (+) Transcript_28663:35-1087(+)